MCDLISPLAEELNDFHKLATTISYLDSFEDETKKQISRVLVPK